MLPFWIALSLTVPAHAKKPEIPRIDGNKECTLVKGSDWGCGDGTGEMPARFSFEVTKNEMVLDLPGCKARRLKHAFHFRGDSCLLASIDPEAGKPELVHVNVRLGCGAYFRCQPR